MAANVVNSINIKCILIQYLILILRQVKYAFFSIHVKMLYISIIYLSVAVYPRTYLRSVIANANYIKCYKLPTIFINFYIKQKSHNYYYSDLTLTYLHKI